MPEPSAAAAEPHLSVIAPVYNEVGSLAPLHAELAAALADWPGGYEIVLVDDGSRDGSADEMDRLAAEDPHVVAVHLRRNFGQTAALAAGLDHARGAVLVPIDADGQNDPADIPRLVAMLDEGYDVVSGWRKQRKDRALTRRFPSRAANALISRLTGVRLHDYGCSLKAYRRDVIEGVRLYGEMHRFVPVYAHMNGGRVAEMVVNHRPRTRGVSKYGLGRAWKVFLDLLLVKFLAVHAAKPIHVFGGFGLLCLLGALTTAAAAVVLKLAPRNLFRQRDFVETPLPTVTAVLVLVGILAVLQGLLAEMLMRTYFESQGKRTYLVGRSHGR